MVVTAWLRSDLKDSRHRKIEISSGPVHHIVLGSCSVRRYTIDLDCISSQYRIKKMELEGRQQTLGGRINRVGVQSGILSGGKAQEEGGKEES